MTVSDWRVVCQMDTYLVGVHVKRINRQVVSSQVQTLENLLEGEISGRGQPCQSMDSRRLVSRQVVLLSITEDHNILLNVQW